MPEVKSMRLDELTIDETIDPRTIRRTDERIEAYADNIDGLPPILVDDNNRILDGIHRYYAHKRMKRDFIKVEVVQAERQLDALKQAIKANTAHGLGLTAAELKRDAIRLWEAGATEEDIANTVARSPGTVQSYLAEPKQQLKEKQMEMVVKFYKEGKSQTEISESISESSSRSINQKTVSNYLREYRKKTSRRVA